MTETNPVAGYFRAKRAWYSAIQKHITDVYFNTYVCFNTVKLHKL